MKLNLGVGTIPIHPQHLEVMGGLDGWTLVDKFTKHELITNWDATDLPVDDNSVEIIYSSHLLEHIPHVDTTRILKHWYDKLVPGGELILNVPDLMWAISQVLRFENEHALQGYYNRWNGEHGLLSVIFGSQSHDGEYHKTGFTERSLRELLTATGFVNNELIRFEDAHDMGVIFSRSTK